MQKIPTICFIESGGERLHSDATKCCERKHANRLLCYILFICFVKAITDSWSQDFKKFFKFSFYKTPPQVTSCPFLLQFFLFAHRDIYVFPRTFSKQNCGETCLLIRVILLAIFRENIPNLQMFQPTAISASLSRPIYGRIISWDDKNSVRGIFLSSQ